MAKDPTKRGPGRPRKTESDPAVPAEPKPITCISERDFIALYKAVKSAKADKNEAVGRHGSLIAQAVEKKHLHKRAWALFQKLDALEANQLAETWWHLEQMIMLGGLDQRMKQQLEMFDRDNLKPAEPPADEQAHDNAPEQMAESASNVHHLASA
jgi:hypothetical protein